MIALVALLLAAATPPTALDAERAFDAAAARDGQFTAFRAFAAGDAIMWTPRGWAKAQDQLKDRTDPPKSIRWQPTASYISCDGKMSVNTGAWQGPDGGFGYFTTVWQLQDDGQWKWRIDYGDDLAVPRPSVAEPVVRRAACPAKPIPIVRRDYFYGTGGDGGSPDGSLQYHRWEGVEMRFRVEIWNGQSFDEVIADRVARR